MEEQEEKKEIGVAIIGHCNVGKTVLSAAITNHIARKECDIPKPVDIPHKHMLFVDSSFVDDEVKRLKIEAKAKEMDAEIVYIGSDRHNEIIKSRDLTKIKEGLVNELIEAKTSSASPFENPPTPYIIRRQPEILANVHPYGSPNGLNTLKDANLSPEQIEQIKNSPLERMEGENMEDYKYRRTLSKLIVKYRGQF